MPQFVIEKSIPDGQLSPFQRDQSVRRSCSTLHGVAPDVEWVQSYLTEDKCYQLNAPSEQVLRDLIKQWDLPPPISIWQEVHQIAAPDIGRKNAPSVRS